MPRRNEFVRLFRPLFRAFEASTGDTHEKGSYGTGCPAIGCGLHEGVTGSNIARASAIKAGVPVTAGGFVVSRYCASGLQAVASAAHHIMVDGANVCLAGGIEHVTLTQPNRNTEFVDDWILEHKGDLYMPMIGTADTVAKRYSISREVQDEYGLQSQQRTAAAQEAGLFAD